MSLVCRSLFILLSFFFWPSCCLFFFDLRILITTLVSFGHCVVCSSSIYGFWLPLWYLLAIALSVLLRFTDSDYHFGIFKLFLQTTNRWSTIFNMKITWFKCRWFILMRLTWVHPPGFYFCPFSFGQCIVCPLIYGFWLPLWYLQTFFSVCQLINEKSKNIVRTVLNLIW